MTPVITPVFIDSTISVNCIIQDWIKYCEKWDVNPWVLILFLLWFTLWGIIPIIYDLRNYSIFWEKYGWFIIFVWYVLPPLSIWIYLL